MNTREIFEDSANWMRIPVHCAPGLRRYIENGVPVGAFLRALLSNDLRETFAKADDINRHRVYDYLIWLYNDAPIGSWGSPDNYAGWIARGGLLGLPPVQPPTMDDTDGE